jgi:hypothetical protein
MRDFCVFRAQDPADIFFTHCQVCRCCVVALVFRCMIFKEGRIHLSMQKLEHGLHLKKNMDYTHAITYVPKYKL